ncbi:MAG: ElyC/SanA/YdcF family protein [Candidatus Omnitrophica bacterium]|nr:ElyC/SanA/YdcF family protein [Candidatus Omnitrophota bacterium]
MLTGKDIICISSIDWDFIWQTHQEIMAKFARNGNRVLFIENTGARAPNIKDIPRIRHRIKNWLKGVKGFRMEMDNLYIFSPLILPFPYSRIARWINRHLMLTVLQRWLKVMGFNNPIIYTFLPTPLSLDIIDNFSKKIIIYYCADALRVISQNRIKDSQISLLKKADLVFVTARQLYDYSRSFNDKVYTFSPGVDFKKFERAMLEKSPVPDEIMKNLKRPIIGYVGGLHKWVDQNLIKNIAEKYPEYSFVFLGPIQTDISLLSGLKNIHFLGKQDHGLIPYFINEFDICIIPYLISDYTKNVYPTKLNEYHAMGKPVVSTDLPEIANFNSENDNLIFIGRTYEEFGNCISKILNNNDKELISRRIESAKRNNWDIKIEQMSSLIEAEIERKEKDREASWKEDFLYFYRVTRRRLLSAGSIFFIAYLLLFKMPLIWFIASPLKLADKLQQADVIVVFGGGVGETGSPGKSTIERARYAVQLYKQNYAENIIFSSGYTYRYNDAENMKLVALSMGIPDKNIILEQKANSAYENVKFTKEILDRKGWSSILLVTSPYNMARVSLVFKKIDGKYRIIHAPVSNPQFYDRKAGSRWQQINAILHEYLGIIYYWWKGWV